MKKTYRMAFIGGNVNSAIGITHKIASQMDGKFILVSGAFSRNDDVNQKTAEEYNIDKSHVYADYKELLIKEKNNVDVIVVLVSTDLHEEVVINCLNAGYNVICEKSLTTSYEAGKNIIETAKKNNSFLAVTYNYTGYPMLRVLKRKIKEGCLGNIISINIEMPQEGYIRLKNDGSKPVVQKWRLHDYKIPTISLDLGTHLHNMIAFFTDETPLQITAEENSYGFFKDIVDDVKCLIKYTNNLSVNMWYSKSALGSRNGLKIRLYGTSASAEWYQMEPEILKIAKNDGTIINYDRSNDANIGLLNRYNRFKAGHPIGFIEAFANYYVDLYKVLSDFEQDKKFNSEYIISMENTLEGLKLFEGAHKASKYQNWVQL